MKNNKGFNLINVIIIMCITSIISGITAGVIVTNGYNKKTGLSYNELASDNNLKEFLEVYSSITNNYYEDVDKEEMLDNAIDAMLNYLGDAYTTYLNDEETANLEKKLAGKYKGIGIQALGNQIIEVMANTPAEDAGLMVGDIITKINENTINENNVAEIPNYISNSENEVAKITVLRNDKNLDFTVKITEIYTIDVHYNLYENNIGYIDIDIFSKTVGDQTKEALANLESVGMQKLIIDLRDNTGGYLESAEEIANIFLKKGELIYSLENKNASADYYDKTDEYKEYPIVIILNEKSASASEILAASLKDSYGATFVGTKSYGKGKVQQTYTLNDGSMAKYTSAKWLRPNGECIDGIGLKPDYEVVQTVTQDENGNIIQNEDTQLLKAIEVINAL